jgi:hypothetical protein
MNLCLYLSIENIRLYMSFNEIIQRPFYTVQHILEFSWLAHACMHRDIPRLQETPCQKCIYIVEKAIGNPNLTWSHRTSLPLDLPNFLLGLFRLNFLAMKYDWKMEERQIAELHKTELTCEVLHQRCKYTSMKVYRSLKWLFLLFRCWLFGRKWKWWKRCECLCDYLINCDREGMNEL